MNINTQNFKSIIIKVSGESIRNKNNIFDYEYINDIIKNLIIFHDKYHYKIIIIIGGGNIWRGKQRKKGFSESDADYMGMFATVINGIYFKNIFKMNKKKSMIFSSLKISKIKSINDISKLNNYLSSDKNFFIIVGGTGLPYFTTDTMTAKIAIKTNSKMILFAKNGVDGVYNDDPIKHPDAYKYSELTFDKKKKNKLNIIEINAIKLLKKSKIQLFIFNSKEPKIIQRIFDDNFKGTKIFY